MAKLGAYYSLCPLIDQKSLLGVAEDSMSGCVVVTLGKNMVIRYKLLNQKQIGSWSSKDKLSSPVIYDNIGKQYIAVFNKTQLRMWTEDDENLDKVKKLKFQEQIHCILAQKNGDEPLIVFNNGVVEALSTALETRKMKNSKAILSPDEEIEDCHLVCHQNATIATFFSHNSEAEHFYHTVPINVIESPKKIKIVREQVNLMGQCTIKETCQFLTLWSDGKMFSIQFLENPSPVSPGTLVNVVRSVSTKHPVAMTSLSASHIAMYGADPSEEGAVVLIYNIHYGVVQSRHQFKLLASPPRLWCMSTSLLIAMTHNLVVLPYQLGAQRLSELVGAHCSAYTKPEEDPDIQVHMVQCDGWEACHEAMEITSDDHVPEPIKIQLNALEADGYPQSLMMETFLPQLMEKDSISELLWCSQHFTDIPEKSLAQILQFCLDKSATLNKGGQYTELLNIVLSIPFSEVCLLPFLRTISFPQVLSLLEYLADKLESDNLDVDIHHLVNWTNILLDAHYQHYLLSGDPQVQELLSRLREISTQQIAYMNELKGLLPLLQLLQEGKLPIKKPAFANKLYSIELLRLY